MKERLHTADHILYSILFKRFNAKTKGMEFYEDSCRVDYECEQDLRLVKDELEAEVSKVINESHEVLSYKLPREEAKKHADISLVPESIKEINIYEIVGFNKIACAGPHVKNTKEIGKFNILKIEKKGKNRFSIKYSVN